MPKNRCLVKNCETNNAQSKDSGQVFGVPQNRSLKRKWLNFAVKPSDPGPPYGICSLHFSSKDLIIITWDFLYKFETNMNFQFFKSLWFHLHR